MEEALIRFLNPDLSTFIVALICYQFWKIDRWQVRIEAKINNIYEQNKETFK